MQVIFENEPAEAGLTHIKVRECENVHKDRVSTTIREHWSYSLSNYQ